MTRKKISTEEVRRWWNENPFTMAVATGDYKRFDQVGRIDESKMDQRFFDEIDRKFRKHTGKYVQVDGRPLLSSLIDYENEIKYKKVLDIATGSGLHTVSFAANTADVTGIDLTPYAITETTQNLKVRGLKANILEMDAQELKLSDQSFDFVNAWGCLMHMPDTDRAISEIYRVLKPRGKMLAYMYNKSSWPFWFNIFLLRGVLSAGLIKYHFDIDRLTSRYSDGASTGGNMLTKFYTPQQIRKVFKSVGFSNVKVFPLQIDHEPDHWPMRSVPIFKFLPKRIKVWMAKRWGYGLIIKAEK